VLEAVLFDWSGTLMQFQWSDELLAAGHRAGLEALGREADAVAFTAGFATRLPSLLAAAAPSVAGYNAELRELLGPVSDDELDRFVDAEYDAWRPARSLVDSGHALLDALHGRGLRLGIVANTWPEPARLVRRELAELGVAQRVDAIVLSEEVGARKPDPAIFERALAELGVEAEAALFVGDRLVDDVQGAAAVGMTTAQALWFRADDAAVVVEPDVLAFTPMDVLNVVRRLVA
jgi:HAD superfamily hydrolase (TIGR01549 family)